MKFLVIFLLIPFTLYASDVPLKITDRVSAQASLIPDIMSASLSVTYSSSDFAKASAQMEKIVSVLKTHSDTCDYNSYSVSPVYTYDNREKKLASYQANISFPCRFVTVRPFEAVLNDIHTVTSSDKSFTLSQSPVFWVADEQKSYELHQSLKFKVLQMSSALADQYSKTVSKSCSVSSVTFTNAGIPYFDHVPMVRSASLEVSAPDRTENELSVSAEVLFICK